MANDDQILHEIRALGEKVQDVRERMIRIETHDYPNRLNKVETQLDQHHDRLTVLDTQGRFFSAGVSAGVAVIVSVLGAFISRLFGHG